MCFLVNLVYFSLYKNFVKRIKDRLFSWIMRARHAYRQTKQETLGTFDDDSNNTTSIKFKTKSSENITGIDAQTEKAVDASGTMCEEELHNNSSQQPLSTEPLVSARDSNHRKREKRLFGQHFRNGDDDHLIFQQKVQNKAPQRRFRTSLCRQRFRVPGRGRGRKLYIH